MPVFFFFFLNSLKLEDGLSIAILCVFVSVMPAESFIRGKKEKKKENLFM